MSTRVLTNSQQASELFNAWLQDVHNLPTYAHAERLEHFNKVDDAFHRWTLYIQIRNLPRLPL